MDQDLSGIEQSGSMHKLVRKPLSSWKGGGEGGVKGRGGGGEAGGGRMGGEGKEISGNGVRTARDLAAFANNRFKTATGRLLYSLSFSLCQKD